MDTRPDPHMGKALAHAPDRDAEPPQHVSAQILAAAHREATAAVPKPQTAALPWWRRRWGASGAFTTVLMAGFIGLLWRGEPPGPALDGPAAESRGPAAAAPPTPAAAPHVAAAPLPGAEPAHVAPRVGGPSATVAPVQKLARQRPDVDKQAQQAKEGAHEVERSSAKRRFALLAPAAGRVAADQAMAAVALFPAPPAPPPAQAAGPALLTALPNWQPGDQIHWEPDSPSPLPDASWLQQLATLTRTAWVRSAEALPPGAHLQWQRSGGPLGTLQLETGVVWWCAAGQNCLRAEVPPDALRDLVGQLTSKR